ncbi:glucose-6-phosphate dehydrogenase assembly protein OpcA [Leucobacter allii]|uniref:Glucose-6-phosphate dehydrogenase assembly protein OpcA n=1 Tax=Leucobacter allii TaxID=2932247 RepID=A0ABY4FQB8_9MICO|nr:glucose-6-phosphate dehydrogenase assembly protein OpcA [Leucobacter allii]UOQ58489.1 glucose-6-phosphate dehydrogenase assembly protein OpcA [Leucobacter allii]UOR03071.1 glucose-6-phosphate dehydrogenase assembly protein OpcA [Leucobacter allii]
MIESLPNTSISAVARRLVSMRQESGVAALGRVLSLVIAASGPLDEAVIAAANHASNEHPMRVIVLLTRPEGEAGLDAEIRVGADAGASEVVVLRAHGEVVSGVESLVTGLLLPDAPVVVWWPDAAPARPGSDPIGRIAQRRITDAAADRGAGWATRIAGYSAGDTDLAWTRLTRWREYLAAVLDQPPCEPVTAVEVVGSALSPSTELLAAWLELALGVPTVCRLLPPEDPIRGVHSVTLTRPGGDAKLARVTRLRAALSQPGQPTHEIVLPRRSLSECLAEELRGLHEDVMYGRVLEQLARTRAERIPTPRTENPA